MPVENVNMPSRVRPGTIPGGVGNKPDPSLADEIAKIQREKFLQNMANREYGVEAKAAPAPVNQTETLAASIVNKAMDAQTHAADRAEAMANRNDDIARQARAEADKAKQDVIALTLQEMSRVVGSLQTAMVEIQKGNKPAGLSETIKEFRELTGLLNENRAQGLAAQPKAPEPGKNYELELRLQEMRQNHELALKRFDVELAKLNAELNLKKAEFEDNKQFKMREYEEGSSFRNNALTNITKIAQSAASALNGAGIGANAGEPVSDIGDGPPLAKEPKAAVQSFPCQFCKTMITVPPGGGTVTCPNEKCGAKFGVEV